MFKLWGKIKMTELKITGAAILNESKPEFFSELLKKGVDAVEPEMEKQLQELKEEPKTATNEEKYISQYGFFNPENQRLNLHIFGIGSTGSLLTLNLAKLGFNEITCYDFDKLELHNIPNQFYKVNQIGMLKTEALKDIIKEFSDIDINIINEKITPSNIASVTSGIDLNSIIVLCFDNMEARKMVYSQFKGMPISLVDTRMGGLGYSIEVVRLDNPGECDKYELSLSMPTKDLPCGQTSIIYTLSSLAAETSRIITLINNNEKFPSLLRRELSSYYFINNLK